MRWVRCVLRAKFPIKQACVGTFYFTLKDATAQVRCVFFRNRHVGATSRGLQNGQQVVARGKLSYMKPVVIIS